jgi:hypothetical protein
MTEEHHEHEETPMDVRDKVVVFIAGVLGFFLLFSVGAVFFLEVTGRETGNIWGRVFDLVNVLAGGLMGYVAGQSVERSRNGNGDK